MMIYAFGEQLRGMTMEQMEREDRPAIFLVKTEECARILERIGIKYEGEIQLDDAYFSKVETQQDCLFGTFTIPQLLDVLESRYRMMFFVNQEHIVIVDDDGFAQKLIWRIQKKKVRQGESKAKFLYNFVSEFMSRDTIVLEQFERKIMDMEDEVVHGNIHDYQNKMMAVRKELLTLRGYYDQMAELGKELEENENGFFTKKQLKYFGILTDRAERLRGRTIHLLDYAQQVKDAYQAQVDAKQNSNMQFLTIISTIFLPLTLITSWYGMNFKNMPELSNGYPWVILLSAIVLVIIIIIFKKKKIL